MIHKDYKVGDTAYFELNGEVMPHLISYIRDDGHGQNLYGNKDGQILYKEDFLSERDPRVIKYKRNNPFPELTEEENFLYRKGYNDAVQKALEWLKANAGQRNEKGIIITFFEGDFNDFKKGIGL